jgi:RND superfamily putative drug exporter
MSKLEHTGGAAHTQRRRQSSRRTDDRRRPGGPRRGSGPASKVGPIGRLGRYTATHFRTVLVGWLLVALVLGFFAPRVENALSGAGWETTGSQSVQARALINRDFRGLSSYALMTVVYSPTHTVKDPAFRAALARV